MAEDEIVCLTDVKPRLPEVKLENLSPITIEEDPEDSSGCDVSQVACSPDDSALGLVMDLDEIEDAGRVSHDSVSVSSLHSISESNSVVSVNLGGKEQDRNDFCPIILDVQGNYNELHDQTMAASSESSQEVQAPGHQSLLLPCASNPCSSTPTHQIMVTSRQAPDGSRHFSTATSCISGHGEKMASAGALSTAAQPSNRQYVITLPNSMPMALVNLSGTVPSAKLDVHSGNQRAPANGLPTVQTHSATAQANQVGQVTFHTKQTLPLNKKTSTTTSSAFHPLNQLGVESNSRTQDKTLHANSDLDLDSTIALIKANAEKNLFLDANDIISCGLLSLTDDSMKDSEQLFSCNICNESFKTQYGVKYHFKRISFHLFYDCPVHKKTMKFKNKCQFWSYIKKHSPTITTITPSMSIRVESLNSTDMESIFVTGFESELAASVSVSAEKNVPLDPPGTSGLSSRLSVCKGSNSQASSLTSAESNPVTSITFASKQGPSVIQGSVNTEPSITSKSDNVASQSVKETERSDNHLNSVVPQTLIQCINCQQLFSSNDAFRVHLNIHKEVLTCSPCETDFPNECSKVYHDAFHSSESLLKTPARCPDCGQGFPQHKASIIDMFDHLDQCLHFNRKLCTECFCGLTWTSVKNFNLHFIKSHMTTIFSCFVCLKQFPNFQSCATHGNQVHKLAFDNFTNQLSCNFCKAVVSDEQSLKKHVQMHLNEFNARNSRKFIWKCFQCKKKYISKRQLHDHIKTDHVHKAKRCTFCYGLFSSRQLLVKHIVTQQCRAVGYKCKHLAFCVDLSENFKEINYQTFFYKVKVVTSLPQPPRSANSLHATSSTVPPPMIVSLNSNNHFQKLPIACLSKAPGPVRLVIRPPGSGVNTTLRNMSPTQASTMRNVTPMEANSVRNVTPTQANTMVRGIMPNQVNTQKVIHNLSDRLKPAASLVKHQCHLCKIIILGLNNFLTHLKRHAVKGQYISPDMTRCVVCNKTLFNTFLKEHLLNHQKQGVKICVRCQRWDFKSLHDARAHAKEFCGYKLVIGSGEVVDAPGEDSATEESKDEDDDVLSHEDLNLGGPENSEEEHVLFPCLLCGMTFSDKSSQEYHISQQHDGIRTVFTCMLCRGRGKEKLFRKKEFCIKHVSVKHKVCDPIEINRWIKTEEQNLKGQELTAPVGKAADSGQTDGPPAKRLRLGGHGTFLCGKCAFSCEDFAEFSKHIQSHNAKKDPQCPECGLCFTVLPALKKHLFAVHKIKAIDDYLKSKDIFEEEEDDDSDDLEVQMLPRGVHCRSPVDLDTRENTQSQLSRSDNPFECTVCYKVFGDELTLKKHMRSHGMAFIRSKRLRD